MAGNIVGLEGVMRGMSRIAEWGGSGDRKNLLKIHKIVARIGQKSVKRTISNASGTVYVRRSGRYGGKKGPSYDIQKGTLKRSIKVFRSLGSQVNVMVGPRSGTVDKKMSGPEAGVIRNDGYFAHFIHEGDLPDHMGGKGSYNGPNRNFFERGINRVRSAMRAKQLELYRQAFKNYMEK